MYESEDVLTLKGTPGDEKNNFFSGWLHQETVNEFITIITNSSCGVTFQSSAVTLMVQPKTEHLASCIR